MPVRCLTPEEKKDVIKAYSVDKLFLKDIAAAYCVSERTINRVLIEAGLATPVERIKGEAYQAMQLLKKHGYTVEELETLLNQFSVSTLKDPKEVVDEYLMSLTEAERIVLFNTIHKRNQANKNEFNDPRFSIAA